MVNLSRSGVGCFLAVNYVGALAYADDIVLLCPTPSAMRKLLSICDTFANEYDIKFTAQKSKLSVVSPSSRHRQATGQTSYCPFFIGGNQIEHVESFSYLGHIITCNLSDKNDIHYRRNCFIGQINNVLCFFSKQRCSV